MKHILIFDADGVIVSAKRFSEQLARDYDIGLDKTLPFFTGVFNECMEGRADLKEILIPFLQEWGWEKSVDEFLEYWFTSEHSIDNKLIDLVQQLRRKGHTCVIGTNQEMHRTHYMRTKMHFDEWFDEVYSSAGLGCKKPDTEFFRQIYLKLQSPHKSNVWFFDDTPSHIESAVQFGINARLYTDYNDFEGFITSQGWLTV